MQCLDNRVKMACEANSLLENILEFLKEKAMWLGELSVEVGNRIAVKIKELHLTNFGIMIVGACVMIIGIGVAAIIHLPIAAN